jgi:protein-tyrosine phosphatase
MRELASARNRPEVIAAPGLFNLRDLGGYETPQGRLRSRRILRSNSPQGRAVGAAEALRGLGIRSAVDLRDDAECDMAPWLDESGIDVYRCPLLEGETLTQKHFDLSFYNRWLLTERSTQLAGAIRTLCEEAHLPTVIFCVSGKDRTGIVSALILSVAGVSESDIALDYAVTEVLLDPDHVERVLPSMLRQGIPEAVARAAFAAPAAVMIETLAFLREEFGGVDRYLVNAGVDPESVDGIRARLVEGG